MHSFILLAFESLVVLSAFVYEFRIYRDGLLDVDSAFRELARDSSVVDPLGLLKLLCNL